MSAAAGARKKRLALGCAALAAVPALPCVVFALRLFFSHGNVPQSGPQERGLTGSQEFTAELARACPIPEGDFQQIRARPEVRWMRSNRTGPGETYPFEVRVVIGVDSGASARGFVRYEARGRGTMTRTPGGPADRRYIVPVPVSDTWSVSQFTVESCVPKYTPTSTLGIIWSVIWLD